MIAQVLRLTRWELFKVRKRWMPWILLVVTLVVVQATLWGFYAAYGNVGNEYNDGYPGVRGIVTISCAEILDGTAAAKAETVIEEMREDARKRIEQRRERGRCPSIIEQIDFPSGAQVQFGYLASARDHLRYQGTAVHFVGIDEASQIPSRQLEYLHSRIRRAKDDPIPLRYRLASNPGDVSHDWLKDTYVRGADGHRVVYLPGLMTDNPGLDVGLRTMRRC